MESIQFKVRESSDQKQKSAQDLERELLAKHEEESQKKAEETQKIPGSEELEIDEEKILKFIESKHGKRFSKIDELFQQPEKEELPEDVNAFYKFKKETGRSLNEFVMINRDLDKLDPDSTLREYYKDVNPELSEDDIDFMIDDLSETDIDDEITIKKKGIEKKKELEKAKTHLRSIAEKYKAPLESRETVLTAEQKAEFEAFQNYIAKSKTETEAIKRRQEWFQKKTEDTFGDEFKGFEFKLSDDKSMVFSPGDKQSIKQTQSNINNFLKKFMNEEGMLQDAKGYHKSLAVAMNPDQFAKHFYELGAAEALESQAKKDKNIDFSARSTPSLLNKGGIKVRETSEGGGNKLVIKSTT
jgi:hypothetical protein